MLQLLPEDLGRFELHQSELATPLNLPVRSHFALQIPSLGQFSPQCLGVVGHIPLWVAVLTVALRYGLGPAWSTYRPIWLRRFAAEKDGLPSGASDQESGAGPAFRKSWTVWTLSLLLLSVGAAVLGVVDALAWPEHAQLCLTPVFPSVRPPIIRVVLLGGANSLCEDHFMSYSCH